jgi:hypothetical protein
MKTLKIEWKHLDVSGETCDRCSDTGEILAQVVQELGVHLQEKGVLVELTETKLDDTQIPQSNMILFNGIPLEEILDIQVSENFCDSCTSLLGKDTFCRTIGYDGVTFEEIPAEAIRRAIEKILELEELTEPSAPCNCGSKCCG